MVTNFVKLIVSMNSNPACCLSRRLDDGENQQRLAKFLF